MSGIRERHILRSQPKLSNIGSYGPRQPRAVIIFTAEDASASSRRTQILLLCYRRNRDRSIAVPGTGKAQRYFASDLDPLSSRLFDASGIEAVEVVWEFTR
jgi:hypothetical protein